MARVRYRNHKSTGRFPVSARKRAHAVAPAPPSSSAPPAPESRPEPNYHAIEVRSTQSEPRRPQRTGLGVVTPQTNDAWRELLAPDGTPPALPYQIEYVRAAVWQQTGLRPSLRGLTIGQAQRILAALNVDARPLWHSGRDNWTMNVLAMSGKWIAFMALFMLILGVGRADGVPFILLIVAAMGLTVARRERRQAFENRHYRRVPETGRPPAVDSRSKRPKKRDGDPTQKQHGSPPTGGDPYDVDTYLRRLGEEDR